MFYKLAALALFAGLLCFPAIISLEISREDREKYAKILRNEAYDDCKHTISDDNYEILLDGSDLDNEETRAFTTCFFLYHKWMVNKKLDLDQMLNDAGRVRGKPFSPPEIIAAKVVMNICRREAEVYNDEVELVAAFKHCMDDRCLSDV